MKKKGFTLLELMISVSIFIIFSGFLYKVYFDEMKSLGSIGSRSTLQYNAKTAMELVDRQIRDNINMEAVADGGKYTRIVAGGVTLVDVSGMPSESNIYFDLQSHTLRDKSGSILCRGVQSINMDLENNLLRVEIALSSSGDNITVKTSFYLR